MDKSEIGTIILDDDINIVWVNQAITKFFGVNKNELYQMNTNKLINNKIKYIFENPRKFIENILDFLDSNDRIENFEFHILPDSESNRDEK